MENISQDLRMQNDQLRAANRQITTENKEMKERMNLLEMQLSELMPDYQICIKDL